MLDHTIVSEELAKKSTWKIINKSTIGSDHYPIYCTLGLEVYFIEEQCIPRWKMRNVDWEKFSIICSNKITEISELEDDVDECIVRINKIIHNTAEEVIGKRKSK